MNLPNPKRPSLAKNVSEKMNNLFASDCGTPPPSEALSGPHKWHRHNPPQLIEGPFGMLSSIENNAVKDIVLDLSKAFLY